MIRYLILYLIVLLFLQINYYNCYTTHYYVKTVLRFEDDSSFLWKENETVWDKNWKRKIGIMKVDQCPWIETVLIPKENTFYCALPYNDLDQFGRKANALQIPWSSSKDPDDISILKNRWLKVSYKDASAYCQLEDVGPQFDDDFSYVFGTSHSLPESSYGGLAISPNVGNFLGIIELIKKLEKLPDDDDYYFSPSYNDFAVSSSFNDEIVEDDKINKDVQSVSSDSTQSNNSGIGSNNQTSTPSNGGGVNNNENSNEQIDSFIPASSTPHATPTPSNTRTFHQETISATPFNTNDPQYQPPEIEDTDGFTSLLSLTVPASLTDSDIRCTWQFVDDIDVPEGPWKKIVTKSPSDRIVKSFIRHNEKSF